MSAEEFSKTLPHCVGFSGGCDGDLEGESHEPNCPLYGKEEMGFTAFAEAYAAYCDTHRPKNNFRKLEYASFEHEEWKHTGDFVVVNMDHVAELGAEDDDVVTLKPLNSNRWGPLTVWASLDDFI